MVMVKKIAFLDRDGVINRRAAPHDYIKHHEDFEVLPGIFPILKRLQSEGFEFIILTNQRGIARGMFSERDLELIHKKMQNLFASEGIEILDIFYCPHETGTCQCRKPGPGLMHQALQKHEIDLSESLYIGDSSSDQVLAETFRIKYYMVPSDCPEHLLHEFEK